jgi:long-chain acyl-CoA synthetase
VKVKDIIINQKDNDRIAIWYKDQSITYKELYVEAIKHSNHIKRVPHNRNVGIFFHNSIDYAIGYFVVSLLDNVIIPIEDSIMGNTLKSIIIYCEISMMVTNNENYDHLKEMLSDFLYQVDIYNIDTVEHTHVGNGRQILQGDEDEDDVAIMLHTSGTTSNPKKVMLTNANLIANIKSNIASLQITKDDICLIILPMFFGYCNSSQFLSHLYLGARLVIYDSTFAPRKLLQLIDEKRCTNTTCVPSMLFLLVKTCKREKFDLSSLRYLCFGGGIMPVDMLKKIISFFDTTGIIQTYGQTEASPRVTCLLPEDTVRKIGSVGKAIPNVNVNIFDEEDNPVPAGEIGEIVIQGPNVMKGYYKKPDITKQTLRNGWLHTGDLGRFDDEGYLYIVGRIKNIIINGGLNIYPEEIEEVLINYQKIKEVVVLSEKHEILGEVPIAKIVLKENCDCTQEEIIKYCLTKLSSNKVPSKVVFCNELEKTYTGKIKRN